MTENDFWDSIGYFHETGYNMGCRRCVVMDYKLEHSDYQDLCDECGCCEAIKDVYKKVMGENKCQNGNH